jgi:type IV secretory pathway VirB10-like protein
MSTTDPAGPGRPARLAGLALIAAAAIALVIGLISMFSGDQEQTATPPPSSQEPTPPPSSGEPPPQTTSEQPAPPATTPPPVTTTAPPPPPQPPASQQPPSGPGPERAEPVRVYNNSTIKGLAERAAGDFRGGGWNVVQVDNYPGGIIATTTVYFRSGTAEEATARALAKEYSLRVEPRFQGIADAAPGVIVIVTREYNPKSK